MPISPVRRKGRLALRAMVRPRVLAWLAGGGLATGAAAMLPGGPALKVLAGLVAASCVAGSVAREDRRLRDAERLHQRGPRTADPCRAPAPSLRRLRVVRTAHWVNIVGLTLMAFGSLAITGWLLATGGTHDTRHPTWVLVLTVAIGGPLMGLEVRKTWRSLRALPRTVPQELPRSQVTVLGFTGDMNLDVVFVPGVWPVSSLLTPDPNAGDDESRGRNGGNGHGESEVAASDRPHAYAATLGWRIGELIPGDVLVCDGLIEEGRPVVLASDDATDWASAVRRLPWADIWEPSLSGMWASAWAAAAAEREATSGGSAQGPHGRRAAVRTADGLSIPDRNDGLPPTQPRRPPYGTASSSGR